MEEKERPQSGGPGGIGGLTSGSKGTETARSLSRRPPENTLLHRSASPPFPIGSLGFGQSAARRSTSAVVCLNGLVLARKQRA